MRRRIRRQADQGIGGGKNRDQRRILIFKGADRQAAFAIRLQARAQIMLARRHWREAPCARRARAEDAAAGSRPSIACHQRLAGRDARRPAPRPDCRAGPAPGPCGVWPNQVGLPGRTAILSDLQLKAQPHQGRAGHDHDRPPTRRRSPPEDRCSLSPASAARAMAATSSFATARRLALAAPGRDQVRQCRKVAEFENLPWARRCARRRQFIAAAQDRHARPPRDRQLPRRRMPPPATAPRHRARGPVAARSCRR